MRLQLLFPHIVHVLWSLYLPCCELRGCIAFTEELQLKGEFKKLMLYDTGSILYFSKTRVVSEGHRCHGCCVAYVCVMTQIWQLWETYQSPLEAQHLLMDSSETSLLNQRAVPLTNDGLASFTIPPFLKQSVLSSAIRGSIFGSRCTELIAKKGLLL